MKVLEAFERIKGYCDKQIRRKENRMIKKYCDLCGSEMTSMFSQFKLICSEADREIKKYDICPDCVRIIKSLAGNKGKNHD